MRKSDGTVAGTLTWSQVKIGGLGAIAGGDISADGTLMVCRTDVGGAYRRDTTVTPSIWTQVCTPAMPLDTAGTLTDFYHGVYEIAIAPTTATTLQLAFEGRMYRSTDRGVTWADDSLNGATGLYMTSNTGSNKGIVGKLRFDPSNANVAYLGTQKNGLWRRLSTGWAQIASVPVTTEPTDGYRTTIVAIDNTSATTGSSPNVRRSVVYSAVNASGLYKSSDGGGTFALVGGHPGAGGSFRCSSLVCDQTGKLWMCLDNGVANNLYFSTNGGTSWTNVTTTPGYNINLVAIDPKDSTRLVGLAGFKPFCSVANPTTNGALSQSAAGALGGATYFVKITFNGPLGETLAGPETSLAVSANNVLVVAAPPSPPPNAITWNVYVSTTTGTETNQASTIAIGSSWTEPTSGLVGGSALPTLNTAYSGVYQPGNNRAIASVCPLPAQSINVSNIANGQDPSAIIMPHPTLNRDIFLNGWGMFYVNSPWPTWTVAQNGNLVWHEDTAGIEELVAQHVFIHPDGTTFLSAQDRGLIVQNASPRLYATVNYPATAPLIWGHNTDYAIDDHNYIVARTIGEGSGDLSGYSADKGATWTAFAASAAAGAGGAIAISNKNQIVVFPGQNYWPRYSTDHGATWNKCTFSGFATIADSSENGWGFGIPTNNRRIDVCADKDNPGVFYAFNYGPTGNPGVQGIWKSTDGGANWAFVSNPPWAGGQGVGFHFVIQMIAGHLYVCTGTQGSLYTESANVPSFRSENGGVSWTQLGAAINDIYCLSAGVAKPDSSYPYALYALGWLNHSFGLSRSDDKGATWVPVQNNTTFDWPYCMAADMSKFGRVVIGYTGTGFMQSAYDYPMTIS